MSLLASIKLVAGLALALLLFFGGRSCAAQGLRDQLAEQQRISDAKSRALRAAARSFDAFAGVFRSIDAHTVAQLAEGRRRVALAEEAGGHAAAAEAAAVLRARELELQLAEAKRKRPGCRAIFEADLGAMCGVTLR